MAYQRPQERTKPTARVEIFTPDESRQAGVATPGNVCVRFLVADAPFPKGHKLYCSVGEAEKLIRNGVAEAVFVGGI